MSIRVLHLATGLGMGGAEMSLARLLEHLSDGFEHRVLSLTGDQPVGERIRALGVPVTALGLRPGVPDPRLLTHAAAHMRAFRPDIVQTWMYHADLIGGLAARLAGSPPVVWNLRNTVTGPGEVKPATFAVIRLNARLSRRLPERIIVCAEAARAAHIGLGYDSARMAVIPNGVDVQRFAPDPAARLDVRRELGLPADAVLVGMAARFDPQKDHLNFLRAAALLAAQMPQASFVLWGKDVTPENPLLSGTVSELGLSGRVHLLGLRLDSARLTAALDVAALSSAFGEAFPNVVAEALACQVPCAATDVGDARLILGEAGRIVHPHDPAALADACLSLLRLPPAEQAALGRAARERMTREFSLPRMAAEYARVYRDIITARSA